MHCPGSVRLCKGLPDTAGADARLGTFAHKVAESCLRKGTPAASWVGRTSGPAAEFTCDEAMANAVQVYLDAVEAIKIMDNARTQEVKIEEKVAMAGVLAPMVWGTADAIVFSRTRPMRMHVIDYKNGAGVPVDVNDNEQTDIYAAAALVTFAGLKVDEIVTHIVQPNCAQNRPWQSTKARPAMELMKWADEVVLPAAKATQAPDAPLVPGTKQCRYCPAKNQCPALRAETLAVAQNVFDDEDKPLPPALDQLAPADIARLIKMAPRVRKYLDAIEARGHELAHAGTEVPGFKLVAKTGNRAWKSEADAVLALTMAGVDPFEKRKVSSPAQAEKKLGRGKKGIVTSLTSKPSTGTALVPADDQRPAVSSAASAFTKLENS